MKNQLYRLMFIFLFMSLALPFGVHPAVALSPDLVISQVYGGGGNTGAPYRNDFIEIFNRGTTTISLNGLSLQYASATGTGNFAANPVTVLSGSLAPGQYYLVQQSGGATGAALPTPDATGTASMSATGGKVALVNSTTGLACNGGSTPCSAAQLALIKDLVGYDGANFYEGAPAPTLGNTTAAVRLANGCTETDNNAMDFAVSTPTPRNTAAPLNPCVAPDAAPEVTGTFPVDGATDFPIDANLIVTFSEPVNVTGSWFQLSCSVSGASIATTFVGGPTTFTLDPGISLTNGEACTLTVLANQVSDQDGNDPPDNMVMNFEVGFSPFDVCSTSFTSIYTIQGSGSVTPIPGIVTTKGVVVGDFEGSASQQGFYLQDASGDGDAATSDGIFVYTGSSNLVSAGQVVRVTGYARERFNQTTLNGLNSNSSAVPAANIVNCGAGSVTPTDVYMPFASVTDPERFEGMLVNLPQPLVIAEYFNYDRFGELVIALPLDGETRPFTGTAIDEPGPPALERAYQNSLRRITLDDAVSAQNPASVRHPNGDPFSLTNRFRGGDTVQNTTGVLGFDFSLYRIFPTGPAVYTSVNPRPAAPDPVDGSLRVAAMNTLNFFITLDYPSGNPLDNKCGPLQNVECRGADFDQPLEFTRQRDKLLVALAGLDADIIGLNELENTTGVDPLGDPVNGIVAGLNAIFGPGTYAHIDTGVIGTDAIRVGMIYKPAKVTPVGGYQILDSTDDPRFLDTKNRPVLAQTFEEIATGARFTAVVNHLKSKGSDCNDVGDPDLGDGQGNCPMTRTNAAQALVDWLASDPTGSGDSDFIIMGDLNSYAQEFPIDAIKAGADDLAGTSDDYTNLISHFQGTYAYSYVFDGQSGYLDHALANAGLFPQVTGAADWHINADEPDLLDYDTSFKPPEQDAIYEPNAYRSSDHDALVVGLELVNQPPSADAGGPYSANEGEVVSLTASGADPEGTAVTFAWDLNNDGVFETPGQTVNFAAVDGTFVYPVSVQVTDVFGNSNVASVSVNVTNVAPTLGSLDIPVLLAPVNSSLSASANFSDPGILDTHTATFDWGDSAISAGTVVEVNGSGSVNGSHTYTTPGVYAISLTVTDKDGGSATQPATEFVVIYNPTGSFVTGGGWIDSPASALKADPQQTGKATFGLVVRYKTGSTIPEGKLEFHLQGADFVFRSSGFDWLVVNSPRAQAKGFGTINGQSDYSFVLSVIDGGNQFQGGDKFRLKIWDSTTGYVIYDNEMGMPTYAYPTTLLGEGSIVVHK